MKHFTAATIAVALGLALVGCGSSNKTSTSTSTSTSPSTSTTTSTTSATPGAHASPTIDDYLRDSHITETPIHHGDPGPNVDLPVPSGWQLNDNAGTPYGGIILAQPANPSDPPTITALYSKLTGDVDQAKIIQYAPNELMGLPSYQGTGNGQASARRISGLAAERHVPAGRQDAGRRAEDGGHSQPGRGVRAPTQRRLAAERSGSADGRQQHHRRQDDHYPLTHDKADRAAEMNTLRGAPSEIATP